MRRRVSIGLLSVMLGIGIASVSGGSGTARHQGRALTLGQIHVRMVEDGRIQLPVRLLRGIEPAEAARMCGGVDTVSASLNAFLLSAPGLHALIDAGYGSDPDEETGRLLAGLGRAGTHPDSIDLVLITHFHFDHIRGLLTADGRRAFGRAVLRAPQAEHDFWARDTATMAPRHRQRAIAIRSVLAPYLAAGAYRPFGPGEDLGHGLRARAAVGHTPGHSVFTLTSEGKELWFVGDLLHFGAVQFERPDVTVEFDSDPAAARASRIECLGRAASAHAILAATHLPAFVRLAPRGAGFTAIPIDLP